MSELRLANKNTLCTYLVLNCMCSYGTSIGVCAVTVRPLVYVQLRYVHWCITKVGAGNGSSGATNRQVATLIVDEVIRIFY